MSAAASAAAASAAADEETCLYVTSAQRPMAVTHACKGYFTERDQLCLLVAKCNHVEVFQVEKTLEPLADFPVYGTVAAMQMFRPKGGDRDLLFLLTSRFEACVISYDSAAHEFVTVARGSFADDVGREVDAGPLVCVSEQFDMIVMHLYDSLVKVVRVRDNGTLEPAVNVRIDVTSVIDMAVVPNAHGQPHLLALFTDSNSDLRAFVQPLGAVADKGASASQPHASTDGAIAMTAIESTANRIVAVPELGGALVISETSIQFVDANAKCLAETDIEPCAVQAVAKVDDGGWRWLLCDYAGELSVLVLRRHGQLVSSLEVRRLGPVVPASALVYIDNAVVFVGSASGNSQIVQLLAQADEDGCCVEVLESIDSIGPVVDLCVVQSETVGPVQIVTCSGVGQEGSLRVVRSGVCFNTLAELQVHGVRGMWALRARADDGFDRLLVVTFVHETRVFAIVDDALDEVAHTHLKLDEQSLFCGNIGQDLAVQVTPSGLLLLRTSDWSVVSRWAPPAGRAIEVAAASGASLLLSHGGGEVVLLQLEHDGGGGARMTVRAQARMPAEVSCVSLSGHVPEGIDAFAAVALWNNRLALLTLPTLEQVAFEALPGEAIPRAVQVTTLDGRAYVCASQGDGSFFAFRCEAKAGAGGTPSLSSHARVLLGTQPITLRELRDVAPSRDGGAAPTLVFACSDVPTIVSSSGGNLVYTHVNAGLQVKHASEFHCESFPHSLALCDDQRIVFGTIGDLQQLDVTTYPLDEMPRRIVHQASTKTFGVLAVSSRQLTHKRGLSGVDRTRERGRKMLVAAGARSGADSMDVDDGSAAAAPHDSDGAGSECGEQHVLRVFDAQTVEARATFLLDANETACSLTSCALSAGDSRAGHSDEVFVVGTAFVQEGSDETRDGRVLVLRFTGADVDLLASYRADGAVMVVREYRGHVLATSNGALDLLRYTDHEGRRALTRVARFAHGVFYVTLDVRGDRALVGDLMKSCVLVSLSVDPPAIKELSTDFVPRWVTATALLNDSVGLVCDQMGNMVTLEYASAGDDPSRMHDAGRVHWGDHVNRIVPGAMSVQPNGSTRIAEPLFVFGTVHGALGVVARVHKSDFLWLSRLEAAMRSVGVAGVGGLDHAAYREFHLERSSSDARYFVDGDLVEQFLELPPARMDMVAQRVGMLTDEIAAHVRELVRLH